MSSRANVFGQVDEIQRLIRHWCPEQFRGEDGVQVLARAFLNAVACVEDLRAQLRGEEPIRTDYPGPTAPMADLIDNPVDG